MFGSGGTGLCSVLKLQGSGFRVAELRALHKLQQRPASNVHLFTLPRLRLEVPQAGNKL